MSSGPRPVFILGSGRSGTTITAKLLNHLPGVHIAKETGFISQNLAELEHIDDPATLARVIDTVNSWLEKNGWDARASATGFREFQSRCELSSAAAFLHYVWQLDSATPWQDLSFIGDNTPLYVMAIPAIQKLLPNARFIHMVRDPRDVVCSMRKMRFGAYDLVQAALEWHLYLGCWLMAERHVASELRIECRYEDLCTSPEDTLARIAGFLGCSREDAVAALAIHAAGEKASATGFARVARSAHHSRLFEPLNPSRVGRFRKELSETEIRAIEEIAQYGMLAYGYKPSRWHTHPLLVEDRLSLLKAVARDIGLRIVSRLRGR